MGRTLDDYRQLFEVYLETGVLSEDTGDDCLAEYLLPVRCLKSEVKTYPLPVWKLSNL